MSRSPRSQHRNLEVLRRPEGGRGETGPSVSPTTQSNPTEQVVTTLHQLIDTLNELSKAPTSPTPVAIAADMPLLLDAHEAGRLMSVSRSKVLDLASQGAIPSIKIGGSVRIPRNLLTAWIDENTRGANSSSRMQLPAWVGVDRSNER